jgi:hypothetical protein
MLAGMGGVSYGELAAAVSEAGGFGTLGMAGRSLDQIKHEMKVVRDGKSIGTFPVSGGQPGWQTRDGIKVIMEKVTNKHWLSSAINAPTPYSLYSQWALRMTDSGEFIHDAPWDRTLGDTNTSHGCVHMTTSGMQFVFDHTMVGDAVVVTGSPRPYGSVDNRIGDWNVSWTKWLGGNYDLSFT